MIDRSTLAGGAYMPFCGMCAINGMLSGTSME
jgi:hypothetical protein